MKKKLLLTLIVIMLCLLAFGTISASAETEGIYTYTVSSGEATITDCDESAYGAIIIPDTLGGYPVTRIADSAFSGCTSLESITIPKGVTSIGGNAFSGCSSLESITIPDSVTSIGDYAFSGCSNLNSVYITDISVWCNIDFKNGVFSPFDSNPLYVGADLYLNDELVTDLVIPDSVTEIKSYVFAGYQSLTSITIPDSVTSIGDHAFYECTSLTYINWKAINVADLSYSSNVFYNAGIDSKGIDVVFEENVQHIPAYIFQTPHSNSSVNIKSVTLGKNIKSIGEYAFSNHSYKNFEAVYLNDLNAYMNIEFKNYSSIPSYYAKNLYLNNELLTDVVIPNGVTNIPSYIFVNNTNITSITIPDSVTSIGDYAFYDCTSLTSITIPDSVTSIGDTAFSSCSSLKDIYISDLKAYLNIDFGNQFSIPTYYAINIYLNNKLLTDVVIPEGTIKIPDYAFRRNKNITSIIIPDSVTSIGYEAFFYCSSLTSVTIGNSVTSIGADAFYSCDSLTSVTIPDSVTSIGADAFYSCDSLTSVTIPESVTFIGENAFHSNSLQSILYSGTEKQWNEIDLCDTNWQSKTIYYNATDVKEIDDITYIVCKDKAILVSANKSISGDVVIPETVDGVSVTEILERAFDSCANITSVTIPDSVTTIDGRAFYNCTGLTSVTIGNSVTTIDDYVFYNCTGLTSITLGSGITYIGESVFNYCTNLSNVYISDLKAYMNIDYAQYNSVPTVYANNLYLNGELLTDVVIPNGTMKIPKYAFYENTNIKSVIMPDTVSSVGDYAFWGCSNLTSVTLGGGITSIGEEAFNQCYNLESVYITDITSYLNSDYGAGSSNPMMYADKMYIGGKRATKIDIPYGVTKIPDYAFYDCDSLNNVTFPEGITHIGKRAFYGCTGVEEIKIPNDVSSIGEYAFYGCTGLTNLVIPSGVTVIAEGAFYACTSLETLTIQHGTTSIGIQAFDYCKNLVNITIPDSVTSIGRNAFSRCEKLTSITIPGSVTSIDSSAFEYCTNLTSVRLEDGIKSTGKYMFRNCYLLSEIMFPYTLELIDRDTFSECSSLAEITLPRNIKEIEQGAFNYCSNLSTVYYNGNQEEWDEIYIGSNNDYLKNATLKFFRYVTLIGNNGEEINKKKYDIGSLVDISDVSSEYTISVFTDEARENVFDLATPVTDNITLYLSYEVNQYVSKFIDEDGTLISRKLFDYGAKIIPPENPAKEGNAQYSYPFAGWEGYTEGMLQDNEELTFKAIYNQVVNQYTYRFLDDEGNVIKEMKVDYGTEITPPETPIKEGNVKYTYTFSNWNGFTEGMTVQGDIEFTAVFTETINKYTYRFIDHNNEIVAEETVDYGTVITPPQNHARPSTQQYEYVLTGWVGFTEGMTVSKNVSFKAEYREILRKYTYRFMDDVGNTLKEETVEYGTVISPPANPTKPATKQYTYKFSAWDGFTEEMTVTDNINFTAVFDAIVNKYTYQFVDGDDIIKSVIAEYGTVIELPEKPGDKDPYTFDYWKGYIEGLTVTDDITFNSVYKYKDYLITVNGLSSPIIVTYNNNFTIPVQSSGEGYSFAGYYTEEAGRGTQVTNENGESISVYSTVGELSVYPYFKATYLNKVGLIGTDSVIPGGSVTETMVLATDKNATYFIATVKYPKHLNFKNIRGVDFKEATKDSEKVVGDFKYADITCVYDYEGNFAEINTNYILFEIEFDVATDSPIGACEISAENVMLIGDDTYEISDIKNHTLTILPKLAESIKIIGSVEIDKATQFTTVVSPNYTTDKSVMWSINDESVATISQNGTVTPVKNGTVIITATAKDGSGVFATKTVNVICYAKISSLDFGGGLVFTEFSPEETEYTVYVKDYVTSITLTPEFSGGGVLRANGSGVWLSGVSKTFELNDIEPTVITLNRENVTGMTNRVYTITVKKYTEKIEISGPAEIKEPAAYTATVYPEFAENKEVVWSVDKENIATISQDGVLTPIKAGTITIFATTTDGRVQASYEVIIRVKKLIRIDGADVVAQGKTVTLSAYVYYNEEGKEHKTKDAIEWRSGDESVATVSNGKVKGIGIGTTTITAYVPGTDVEKSIEITIVAPIASLKFTSTKATTYVGNALVLSEMLTVRPEENTDVIVWTTSNENVATVDENGVVTAISKGSAKITATAVAGNKKVTCTVTVAREPEGIVVEGDTAIAQGKTATLKAYAYYEENGKIVKTKDAIEWMSDDEGVATVAKGKVKGVGVGTTTITAYLPGYDISESIGIDVVAPIKRLKLSTSKITAFVGNAIDLSEGMIVSPEDNTDVIVWTTSNENVATVDENGVVTAISKGSAKITATAVAGKKKATCTVTVAREPEGIIIIGDTAIAQGKTATLKAYAYYEENGKIVKTKDAIEWMSDDEGIATVAKGKVKGVSAGATTIIATIAGTGIEERIDVTVVVPAKSVKLSQKKMDASVGDVIYLEELLTVQPFDNTDELLWTSANEDVATVDEYGVVTIHSTGKVKITVKAVAGKKSANVTITVK